MNAETPINTDKTEAFFLSALIGVDRRLNLFALHRKLPVIYQILQPEFHRVEIRVRGHKELTVRARSGYFARKG
jgi:hypothetical protein